ncbi:LAMI_0F03334g1_1 [Lachancea mirantina]|uniref:LAMI_0F03334g1_1 n=1 Tax=Lachancea mirantina TaxID=1230905 RepID=A0A1G4JXB2_9SACH|nr:LAMI_0F03334g1_1 [Lachancea mirantina]
MDDQLLVDFLLQDDLSIPDFESDSKWLSPQITFGSGRSKRRRFRSKSKKGPTFDQNTLWGESIDEIIELICRLPSTWEPSRNVSDAVTIESQAKPKREKKTEKKNNAKPESVPDISLIQCEQLNLGSNRKLSRKERQKLRKKALNHKESNIQYTSDEEQQFRAKRHSSRKSSHKQVVLESYTTFPKLNRKQRLKSTKGPETITNSAQQQANGKEEHPNLKKKAKKRNKEKAKKKNETPQLEAQA